MAKEPAQAQTPNVRASHTIRTAPGLLGFSALLTPDTMFNAEGDFTARIHFNEPQQAAMAATVQDKVIDALFDDLQKVVNEMAEKAGQKPKALKKPTGASWLEDKLKDPPEKSRIQLPSIQIKRAATYIAKKGPRAGEVITRAVPFWDKDGKVLDGAKLRTGMGSIVQLVFTPGLYTNALAKGYAEVSLRLEGVIVLKNEPWGNGGTGGGAGAGEAYDDEALAALIGDGVELDTDLTAFAGAAKAQDGGASKGTPPAEADEYDLNDDIPF